MCIHWEPKRNDVSQLDQYCLTPLGQPLQIVEHNYRDERRPKGQSQPLNQSEPPEFCQPTLQRSHYASKSLRFEQRGPAAWGRSP